MEPNSAQIGLISNMKPLCYAQTQVMQNLVGRPTQQNVELAVGTPYRGGVNDMRLPHNPQFS